MTVVSDSNTHLTLNNITQYSVPCSLYKMKLSVFIDIAKMTYNIHSLLRYPFKPNLSWKDKKAFSKKKLFLNSLRYATAFPKDVNV